MSEKVLTVDEMLESDDIQFLNVPVPEWNGDVRIGSLTAGDIIEWLEANQNNTDKGRSGGLNLLWRALVDQNGKRIGKPEHVELFKKKSTAVCGRIVQAIMEMNGLNPVVKGVESAKNDSSEASSGASRTTLH